jgi:hypothetical protein
MGSTDCELAALHDATWQERTGLREEIKALVAMHQDVTTRPPFSDAEMMVMAIVSSPSAFVSLVQIRKWKYFSFPYYCSKALDDYIEATETNFHGYKLKGDDAICDAFDCWEAPFEIPKHLELAEDVGGAVVSKRKALNREFACTVPVHEARLFLRRW